MAEEEPKTLDFKILYEKLSEPEAATTVRTVKALANDLDATAEVARLARDSWPSFTTYSTG